MRQRCRRAPWSFHLRCLVPSSHPSEHDVLTEPWQSRLVVLRSLSNFLRCATQSQLATDKSTTTQAALSLPTWFMRPFFTSPSLYDEHSYLFGASGADRREKQMQWTLEPTFDLFDEDFTYNPHTFAIVPDVPLALTELPGFSALQDKSDSSPDDIAVLIVGISCSKKLSAADSPNVASCSHPVFDLVRFISRMCTCCIFTQCKPPRNRFTNANCINGNYSYTL